MADVQFRRGYQSDYDTQKANNQISNDSLYFILDTRRIYLGESLFSALVPDGDVLKYPSGHSSYFPDGDNQEYGNLNN